MKRVNTLVIVLGALALLSAVAALGGSAWHNHARKRQATESLALAEALLADKRPRQALVVLRRVMHGESKNRREKRATLEILAHLQMRNIPRLLHLYDRYPHLFRPHEEAALFVCRGLLQTENDKTFHDLRGSWRGREKRTDAWLALDVDALLVTGERDAALAMLAPKRSDAKSETVRLIRLALLKAPDHLEEAWGHLEEAAMLAPSNSDVRLFRGQILEQLGKYASARVEYVAAHLAEPDNPRLSDQLAEFYRRRGNLHLALATWEKGLTPSTPGYLWLKAMFWSRMVEPLDRDWSKAACPPGRLSPLLAWLGQLPDTRLWDEETFFQVPDRTQLLSTRQELFWLRVVDHLSRDQETQALLLLERTPFKDRSFHPEMEEALVAILRFRKWGAFPQKPARLLSPDKSAHPLFRQLAEGGANPPHGLTALIKSPEAFSALFLAGGWLEAALRLHRLPEIPKNFPEWVPYGLTQAIRCNRGTAEALSFAEGQPQTPALTVLTGELLLAENRVDEAMTRLGETAGHPSGAGFRAAWFKAMVHLDRKEADAARQTVREQPRLARSLTGRELMARMAVAENNPREATRLYATLQKSSPEAKVWLARQAYADGHWTEARRLTTDLAALYPDVLQFRANLAAIARAEEEATP